MPGVWVRNTEKHRFLRSGWRPTQDDTPWGFRLTRAEAQLDLSAFPPG